MGFRKGFAFSEEFYCSNNFRESMPGGMNVLVTKCPLVSIWMTFRSSRGVSSGLGETEAGLTKSSVPAAHVAAPCSHPSSCL